MLWIDAMKGIGIILVLLIHGNVNIGYASCLSVGYMSMFFVVSGYTYKPANSIREELTKKGKRLLIPYAVYGLFSTILFSVVELIHGNWHNFLQRIVGLFYSRFVIFLDAPGDEKISMLGLTGNPPLWFLTAMFGAFIGAYILYKTKYKVALISLFLLASIAMSYLPFLLPWSFDTVLVFSLFLFYGMQKTNILNNAWKFAVAIVCFYIISKYNGHVNISVREYGQYTIFSFVIFILLGILQTDIFAYFVKKAENLYVMKGIAYLGRISLTIMCLHLPILTKLDPYVFRVMSGVPELVVHLLLITFTLGVCVLFAMFCNKYKSKFPLLKWL